MRLSIIVVLAVLIPSLPAAFCEEEQPPFPQPPSFWVGTWDLDSLYTYDIHEMTVEATDQEPNDGWTEFDVTVESLYGGGGPTEYTGLVNGDDGRLYVGYYDGWEPGNREWTTVFTLDAFYTDDPTARYWGPAPNEIGIATRR